ncbi:DUF2948 family protein [Pelagimonas varians]|uniref:DUF2948 domain-containing protein n=1 Tax=Pelagimonas varians TaxID=696760 RepID=A0A238L5N3_9RHOB|nr:DUF2948 family protein [Pelagimonas varians]PYG25634.1 Protein of unknown function (DUF2948) [Pelagimonas varians]SMX50150.1 hypothetical protein PEV8663_04510 [Pelagimonas varians]
MSEDARFEDGGDQPLNLGALDGDDLQVIAALVQDAVLPVSEIAYQKRHRRLCLLLNRMRHEDIAAAKKFGRPVERVQSLLTIEGVLNVGAQGVDKSDPDMILSILTVAFEAGEDGAGHVVLTLAGDGALRADVEALELTLKDVTRPYIAPSRKAPSHPE